MGYVGKYSVSAPALTSMHISTLILLLNTNGTNILIHCRDTCELKSLFRSAHCVKATMLLLNPDGFYVLMCSNQGFRAPADRRTSSCGSSRDQGCASSMSILGDGTVLYDPYVAPLRSNIPTESPYLLQAHADESRYPVSFVLTWESLPARYANKQHRQSLVEDESTNENSFYLK